MTMISRFETCEGFEAEDILYRMVHQLAEDTFVAAIPLWLYCPLSMSVETILAQHGMTVSTSISVLSVHESGILHSDQIILHLFQPHQADQMFDPQTGSSYVSKH